MKKRIIVLASGNGSNFEAIVKKLRNKYKIKLISENKNAYVLQRAIKLDIDYELINYKLYKSREEYNQKLFEYLKREEPDLIVLAGYMKILPEYIVEHFENQIINIHPSLLPAFKGLNAIKQAFEYGVKYTGITIHYVNNELDGGKIITQEVVKIEREDTLETLEEKIHKLEHKLYPKVIDKILRLQEVAYEKSLN
ncbi:phosphoribosylglycinamide formyltransferase [Marinitoga sp. 1135]|uniref:Phosphoribosylglycinamide formyltransferase n=1 Tax=Marinitoga piezophila (strain DSM 14283 / JCM 11233 / KA3) TaxID=443254 RepID=H2J4H4_MARPK|nr:MULTISPECIES: phosphoribosylglycinamide formyltransferase [Marinitoga]AEX84829.1 phosphoribosylglycinamide formyltransferase, formyltetrahydrofolate-dependent [Marinitoga piezophila KA3]APT75338.1 phosphoribosylglycinamide formyltransferase [Marinitoga sp. 1137]NUU95068.1 phosphoribosylglycinamide formyltransferase [Marinitoga sp. 1135]